MASVEVVPDELNCGVCKEPPLHPKLLQCGHHCCKQCVDRSLFFNDDGSAWMECPVSECSLTTHITSSESSNNLPTSEVGRSCAATAEADTSCMKPLCCSDGCVASVSSYCCGYKMCTSCSQQHIDTEGDHKKVTLYFCPRDKQLKGFCDEHATPYTHVCTCDNSLLCVYCIHRNPIHKRHVKNTIDGESAVIREALLEDCRRRRAMEECRKATEAQIPLSRARLEEVLKKRKEECLAQYAAYLTNEEEKIKSKFQDICGHMRRIAELSLEDDID